MTMMTAGMYSSANLHWGTPHSLFVTLDQEFDFDLDPCPGEATRFGPGVAPRRQFPMSDSPLKPNIQMLKDGLEEDWRPFRAAFVNPPYGRVLTDWVLKAVDERGHIDSGTIVLLLPARTDTAWWHDLILPNAHEIRFVRGRLGFTGVASKPERDRQKQRSRAPFPSVVVVL